MSIYAFNIPNKEHKFLPVIYHDWFTPEQCEQIISMYAHKPTWAGGIVRTKDDLNGAGVDNSVRRVDIHTVSVEDSTRFIYDRFYEAVEDANNHFFKFDITGFMEQMQLLHYNEPTANMPGGFYDWHTDTGIGPLSTRKLTCILQLTDPSEYDGCNVEVMGYGQIPVKQGTMVVFPSFVHHRVLELTRGHRDCVVAWVNGTPFR